MTEIRFPDSSWLAYIVRRVGLRTPQQQLAVAYLLNDPHRSNRVIAAEAGLWQSRVRRVRLRLEDDGLVPVYRAPNHPPPLSVATAHGLLIACPARTNRAVASLAGCAQSTVACTRYRMETAREICVWRGGAHDDECWCKLEP